MKQRTHRIVTADGRRASLYTCTRDTAGRVHLEPAGTFENSHEAEHERHRPGLIGGGERRGSTARSGAHAAPHAVSPGNTADEEQRRFAQEICAWLVAANRGKKADRTTLFAPPRLLSMLSPHASSIGGDVVLQAGEFAQLRAAELAEHPAIMAAAAEADRAAAKG